MQTWLDENLARLIAKHDVPAASIAVFADGEVSEAAAGVLNLNTGVEATTDSVFQIGSITKLWTTTLIMQLVAEDKVDLDRPVRDYLPEFKLADEVAAAAVTPRHLLIHTGGFSGDAFTPTSRGDDGVELYVRDVVPGLAQEVPLGAGFSYNNAGFVILGRIAEVLRGKPYHELVREHIVVPLEQKHVATIPDEALLYRTALGHISPKPGAPLQAAPQWSLVHGMAPAGALLAMSARDLIAFGRAYLDATLLDRSAIDSLWEPQVDVPPTGGLAEQWGLGWMIFSRGRPALRSRRRDDRAVRVLPAGPGQGRRGRPAHQRWRRPGPVRRTGRPRPAGDRRSRTAEAAGAAVGAGRDLAGARHRPVRRGAGERHDQRRGRGVLGGWTRPRARRRRCCCRSRCGRGSCRWTRPG